MMRCEDTFYRLWATPGEGKQGESHALTPPPLSRPLSCAGRRPDLRAYSLFLLERSDSESSAGR
jgi:hypothetical protein